MTSELKKLYLLSLKQPNNYSPENKIIFKENSIKNLSQLLNQHSLPSIVSIGEGDPPKKKKRVPKTRKHQSLHQPTFSTKFIPSLGEDKETFLPHISPKTSHHRLKYLEIKNKQDKDKQYQKYINQYMKNLDQRQLYDMYQKNPKELVKQACIQIKKKIKDEKRKSDSLENPKTSLSAEKEVKKQIFKDHTKAEQLSSTIRIKKQTSNLLEQGHRKKSKSLAQQKLLELDLERIEKNTELQKRERRRTQKYFIRRLSKFSEIDSMY